VNGRRYFWRLGIFAALCALIALATILTTCGGGGRKKPPITPPPAPPSTGTTEWMHTWGGGSSDYGSAIRLDGSGNTYVAGDTQSFGAGYDDALLLKYSPSADLLWRRTWGGSGHESAVAIALDGNGQLRITGITDGWGPGTVDTIYKWPNVFLIKCDSLGNICRETVYGTAEPEYASGFAIDRAENVYLAGAA